MISIEILENIIQNQELDGANASSFDKIRIVYLMLLVRLCFTKLT